MISSNDNNSNESPYLLHSKFIFNIWNEFLLFCLPIQFHFKRQNTYYLFKRGIYEYGRIWFLLSGFNSIFACLKGKEVVRYSMSDHFHRSVAYSWTRISVRIYWYLHLLKSAYISVKSFLFKPAIVVTVGMYLWEKPMTNLGIFKVKNSKRLHLKHISLSWLCWELGLPLECLTVEILP